MESDGSKHKECTVCKEVLETEKIAKLENKATVTPTVKKEEIKTETKTATQAVKTGDNTNIIEVVCLLVFSLVVLTKIIIQNKRTIPCLLIDKIKSITFRLEECGKTNQFVYQSVK